MAKGYNFIRLKSDTYFLLEDFKTKHHSKSFDQAIRVALRKACEERGGVTRWI